MNFLSTPSRLEDAGLVSPAKKSCASGGTCGPGRLFTHGLLVVVVIVIVFTLGLARLLGSL